MKFLSTLLFVLLTFNSFGQTYLHIQKVGGTDDSTKLTSITRIYFTNSETSCPGIPSITDTRDGRVYHTVQVGTQCWLRENLNIGTMILGSQNQSNNSIIEKYCYNDSVSNCDTYGGLYQWDETMQYVSTSGVKGICPTGWHIPTQTELSTLKTYVNNDGNSLKAIGQGTGAGAGTNSSGFSALLGGIRGINGGFTSRGNIYIWSSSMVDATYSFGIALDSSSNLISGGAAGQHKINGFSVRCIKD